MKKITLFSISLYLFSSLVFADVDAGKNINIDDLVGKWEVVGYMCLSQDNKFTQITDISKNTYYNVEFHANNLLTLDFFFGCRYYGSGTYAVTGSILNIRGTLNLKKDLSSPDCTNTERRTISISERFTLVKDYLLYVEESQLSDELSQKCKDGIIFHRFEKVFKL